MNANHAGFPGEFCTNPHCTEDGCQGYQSGREDAIKEIANRIPGLIRTLLPEGAAAR